jgi:hypothetical protein
MPVPPTTLTGQVEAALRTALQLRRYQDILDPADVWSFLALVGFYSAFYGTCSKVRGARGGGAAGSRLHALTHAPALQAFVKLEALPSLSQERRDAYADLALSIFQHHPPADPQTIAEAREQPSSSSSSSSKKARHHQQDDALADRDQVGRGTERARLSLTSGASPVTSAPPACLAAAGVRRVGQGAARRAQAALRHLQARHECGRAGAAPDVPAMPQLSGRQAGWLGGAREQQEQCQQQQQQQTQQHPEKQRARAHRGVTSARAACSEQRGQSVSSAASSA